MRRAFGSPCSSGGTWGSLVSAQAWRLDEGVGASGEGLRWFSAPSRAEAGFCLYPRDQTPT